MTTSIYDIRNHSKRIHLWIPNRWNKMLLKLNEKKTIFWCCCIFSFHLLSVNEKKLLLFDTSLTSSFILWIKFKFLSILLTTTRNVDFLFFFFIDKIQNNDYGLVNMKMCRWFVVSHFHCFFLMLIFDLWSDRWHHRFSSQPKGLILIFDAPTD